MFIYWISTVCQPRPLMSNLYDCRKGLELTKPKSYGSQPKWRPVWKLDMWKMQFIHWSKHVTLCHSITIFVMLYCQNTWVCLLHCKLDNDRTGSVLFTLHPSAQDSAWYTVDTNKCLLHEWMSVRLSWRLLSADPLCINYSHHQRASISWVPILCNAVLY